jgi:hypothetical protein
MSKALQIYYNAIFGAIGGLLGWLIVGSVDTGSWSIWLAYPFVGAGVGLCIGGMTGAVEGVVIKQSIPRALLGMTLGAVAGLVSGLLGLLLGEVGFLILGGGLIGRMLGWMLLGLLLGVGEGIVSRSQKRASYGAVGGAIAGAVGGFVYEAMTQAFLQQSDRVQMIVGAFGLLLIGACLGAIIPLTIIGLARGSLYIRSGKRQGLEVAVVDAVTIGSYDGCELYLPGDPQIEKKHARVYRKEGRFFLEDLNSRQGTFLNGARVAPGVATVVAPGAKIRLGGTEIELRG